MDNADYDLKAVDNGMSLDFIREVPWFCILCQVVYCGIVNMGLL